MRKLLWVLAALGAAAAVADLLRRGRDDEPMAAAPAPAAPAPTPDSPPEPATPKEPATGSSGGDGVEGYCVSERKKVEIKDPRPTKTKNGRDAVQGTCPDCGAKIFRFGKA